ncbi:MAG: transposase [Gammaproteobacteria bacterium RIFCSPHIGHO2_12_FULL_38_11]|nr:MAG: transposase [Gammaproteobacteria bacterium RIFCSPHIGHO2_12_FULL_38_11]
MKIKKAYKFKLKPSNAQQVQLNEIAGGCRFLWNKVLRLNLDRLQNKYPLIWYHEADFWSKLWKSSDEYRFLKIIPAHCLQQKLKDLDKAFRDAFDKKQLLKRLPKFKKKKSGDSFRFPEPKHITINNRRIKLPKIGWVGFYKSQEIIGNTKNVTISKKNNEWFVSIQVECENKITAPAASIVGIDLGVAQFATLSDGTIIKPIHAFRKQEKQLTKAQKNLSRKTKFSLNWRNQRNKIQQIHSKITHIRHDFLHKTSSALSKSHAVIVMEDLKITNMSKSASGTIEIPGKNVKAKSGLNKSLLDQSFGEFKRQLEYKLNWNGGILIEINPQYTSQKCHMCGHVAKENRKSQSEFSCIACHHSDNADTNAAKNILAAGHAVLACGEIGLPNSMKQEPLRNCEKVAA